MEYGIQQMLFCGEKCGRGWSQSVHNFTRILQNNNLLSTLLPPYTMPPGDFTPSYTPDEFSPQEIIAFFKKYIEKKQIDEIREIMTDPREHVAQHGLKLPLDKITYESMGIGTMLLHYPQKMIQHCNEAIRLIQEDLHDDEGLTIKVINTRLEKVPPLPDIFKKAVSDLRNYNIGRLVLLQGTVVRTSTPTVVESERRYKCKQCQKKFSVYAEIDSDMAIEKPKRCPFPDCGGNKFQDTGENQCKDLQEIKVQDKVTNLQVGRIPRSLACVMEDDLVDVCKPGDDVEVTGYLLRQWKNHRKDDLFKFDTVFHAVNIRVVNQNKSGNFSDEKGKKKIADHWRKYQDVPLKGRDVILKSVCPRLYGMWRIKLSLLLTLIGGVSKQKGSTRTRGESHILMVGDPGTGKSQLLKFAASVARRNVFTTGTGSSTAGLTVMAAKDTAGAWVLEAGALVLADGGVCCIDEFSCISEHDRSAIHEAMEQQTLSIAKAGLVCKLNSRCTIVAACNPKGKFDKYASLTANTTLASPLLSRFDIIIVLQDDQDEEWDRQIADYILNQREKDEEDSGDRWSFQDLKAYLSHVKQIKPTLSQEAVEILRAYYNYQRTHTTDQSQITVRFLESLIRISQAHARLMHRKEVTEQDAIMGMIAIDTSKNVLVKSDSKSLLYETFPDDPDEWYEIQREHILDLLGIRTANLYDGVGGDPRPRHVKPLPADYEPRTQQRRSNTTINVPSMPSDDEDMIDQVQEDNKRRFMNHWNGRAYQSKKPPTLSHPSNYAPSEESTLSGRQDQSNGERSKGGRSNGYLNTRDTSPAIDEDDEEDGTNNHSPSMSRSESPSSGLNYEMKHPHRSTQQLTQAAATASQKLSLDIEAEVEELLNDFCTEDDDSP